MAEKPTLLYMVTRIAGRQYKFPTGVKVYPRHWLRDSYRARTTGSDLTEADRRNNMIANTRLEELAGRFEAFKKVAATDPCDGSHFWLKLRAYLASDSRETAAEAALNEAFRRVYPEELTKEGTLTTNRSRLRRVIRFIRARPESELDQRLVDRFSEHLTAEGLGVKRINECCGLLKRLINRVMADKTGGEGVTKVSYSPQRDRRRHEDAKRCALNEEEIDALRRVKLAGEEDSFRRLFLLQVESGVRSSDIKTLISKSLNGYEECVTLVTRKEGIKATVILTEGIRKTIGHFQRGAFYSIRWGKGFQSAYNKRLKTIAKKAGLTRAIRWTEQRGGRLTEREAQLHEVISTHFARHTFISMRVREGWNAGILRLVTGHADETMIRRVYTHLTEKDRHDMVMREQQRISSRITDSRTT